MEGSSYRDSTVGHDLRVPFYEGKQQKDGDIVFF